MSPPVSSQRLSDSWICRNLRCLVIWRSSFALFCNQGNKVCIKSCSNKILPVEKLSVISYTEIYLSIYLIWFLSISFITRQSNIVHIKKMVCNFITISLIYLSIFLSISVIQCTGNPNNHPEHLKKTDQQDASNHFISKSLPCSYGFSTTFLTVRSVRHKTDYDLQNWNRW